MDFVFGFILGVIVTIMALVLLAHSDGGEY